MTPSMGSGFSPIFYEDHIFVTLDHESAFALFALFALKREKGKKFGKSTGLVPGPRHPPPPFTKQSKGKPRWFPLHNLMDVMRWI